MPSGTVKWFNAALGVGFIVPNDGGDDVYVHISVVRKSGFDGMLETTTFVFKAVFCRIPQREE
jgi:CspA family cold shock protein